jgi:hypothetical protein
LITKNSNPKISSIPIGIKSPFSYGYRATFSLRTIQLNALLKISLANASLIDAAYTGVRGLSISFLSITLI